MKGYAVELKVSDLQMKLPRQLSICLHKKNSNSLNSWQQKATFKNACSCQFI